MTRAPFSTDLIAKRPIAQVINEQYKKRSPGGKDLYDFPARAFTGMMTLLDAINRAGSTDPEAMAGYSISSLGTGWQLRTHEAHLVATLQEADETPTVRRLLRFSRLLAGVVDGVDGVLGIYCGLAHAPGGEVAMSYYSQHERLPLPSGQPTPDDIFLARFTV